LTDLGTEWIFEFAERLEATRVVQDIIVMGTPDLTDLVLLEGHARLTALFAGGLQRDIAVKSYLGISDELSTWDCF
jgi:hypothetical protein